MSSRGEGQTLETLRLRLRVVGGCWPAAGWTGTVQLWGPSGGASLRILRSDRRYERVDITA